MRIPPQIAKGIQAAVAAVVALLLLPACDKPAPPAAGAAKPAPAKTNSVASGTNRMATASTSVFTELMPPKGRDPFFPNSHRRDPVPVVASQPGRPAPVASSLTLKGIVGSPAHRLALVNNAILQIGEQDTVSVPGGHVQVKCLEIGEDYAVFKVEGEPQPKRLELNKKPF